MGKTLKHWWTKLPDQTELFQLAAVGVQGVVTLLGIIQAVAIVRFLGPDNYGLIALTVAVGGVFSSLQHLGLGVGVAKEAARVINKKQLGPLVLAVLGWRLALLLPLLALLILVAAPVAAAIYHRPELHLLILLYALGLLLSSPGDVLGYLLTGSDQFRVYFLLRIFSAVFTTVAVLLATLRWAVHGYFVGLALAGLMNTALSAIVVRHAIGQSLVWPSRNDTLEIFRSAFRTSFAVYLVKLLRNFSVQVPVLVAGLFLSTAELGWLKFGLQTGMYFRGLVSSVVLVTLPRMVRLHALHGRESLLARFASNFRRVACGTGLLLVPSVVLAREIVGFMAGAGFVNAWPVSQWALVFSASVALASNIFAGIHLPLSMERSYVLAHGILLIVSLAGTMVFVPLMKNAEGAALALTVGGVALMTVAIWQIRALPLLPSWLMHSSFVVLVAAGISLSSMGVESLGWRLVIGMVAMSLLVMDIWHTDRTAKRLIRSGTRQALSVMRFRF